MKWVSLFNFICLGLKQRWKGQCLQRIPEPAMLMETCEQVVGYHLAGETTLDPLYCLATEMVSLAVPESGVLSILDLGCGPGNFLARLASIVPFSKIHAVDASQAMLDQARKNPKLADISDRIEFVNQDITSLKFPNGGFDLITCTLTLHHMPDLAAVAQLLANANRLTKPNGVLFFFDLARLKTRRLVDQYVTLFSAGQTDQHNQDFHNSMLAAFTPMEIKSVIPPNDANNRWIFFTGPVLPSLQVVMRVPRDRQLTKKTIWEKSPVAFLSNYQWRSFRDGFRKRFIRLWEKE